MSIPKALRTASLKLLVARLVIVVPHPLLLNNTLEPFEKKNATGEKTLLKSVGI